MPPVPARAIARWAAVIAGGAAAGVVSVAAVTVVSPVLTGDDAERAAYRACYRFEQSTGMAVNAIVAGTSTAAADRVFAQAVADVAHAVKTDPAYRDLAAAFEQLDAQRREDVLDHDLRAAQDQVSSQCRAVRSARD